MNEGGFIGRCWRDRTNALAVHQRCLNLLECCKLGGKRLIALHQLFRSVNTALKHLKIGKNELKIDGFNITNGIYVAVNVNDVLVCKATYHVNDRINRADMSEKFITKTFALRSTLDKTCNVNEFDDSRRVLFRIIHLGKIVKTAVRHGNDTDVRLNRAEGIVLRCGSRIGQCVKKCTFADVRQTNDTKFHNVL